MVFKTHYVSKKYTSNVFVLTLGKPFFNYLFRCLNKPFDNCFKTTYGAFLSRMHLTNTFLNQPLKCIVV